MYIYIYIYIYRDHTDHPHPHLRTFSKSEVPNYITNEHIHLFDTAICHTNNFQTKNL